MLNTTLQLKRLSSTSTKSDNLRIVVFTLTEDSSSANLDDLFALPVEAVLKAIPCPPVNWAVDSGIGIADVDSQNVTVLDLRQQFALDNAESREKNNLVESKDSQRFLILLKTRTEELCGIVVAYPPTITDIPLTAIRPVPSSYRQVAGLNMASHMAILSETEDNKPLKVFLLGMSKIITNSSSATVADNSNRSGLTHSHR